MESVAYPQTPEIPFAYSHQCSDLGADHLGLQSLAIIVVHVETLDLDGPCTFGKLTFGLTTEHAKCFEYAESSHMQMMQVSCSILISLGRYLSDRSRWQKSIRFFNQMHPSLGKLATSTHAIRLG